MATTTEQITSRYQLSTTTYSNGDQVHSIEVRTGQERRPFKQVRTNIAQREVALSIIRDLDPSGTPAVSTTPAPVDTPAPATDAQVAYAMKLTARAAPLGRDQPPRLRGPEGHDQGADQRPHRHAEGAVLMSTIYTTRGEATEREVVEALGDYATDYDVEAIADEVLEWHVERDEQGREIVTEGRVGYRVADGVDFWEVAARHDRAAGLGAVRDAYLAARDERRRLVVEAVQAGMPKSRVSDLSGVSRPTIDKWLAAG